MYEGYGPELTAFPVRVMKALGVSNAGGDECGGRHQYDISNPGDLMLIGDHINLTGPQSVGRAERR